MLHARVHGRAVAFGSNDQKKCFDTMLQGVQLLGLRPLPHPGPVSGRPPAPADPPHAGRRLSPPTTRAVAFNAEVCRRMCLRLRLPNQKSAVGPVVAVTSGASQGLTSGCESGNTYAEWCIRCVKRAFQRRMAYRFATPKDVHASDEWDDVPVITHYSDDDQAIVGDTTAGSADQNITDVVCGAVVKVLSALGQHVENCKSWALHQVAGAPRHHVYHTAAGEQVSDASERPYVKTLGFFFSTDARRDAAAPP